MKKNNLIRILLIAILFIYGFRLGVINCNAAEKKGMIIFSSNDSFSSLASGTMTSVEASVGVEITLPDNKYVRKGYTFICWNTEKDGSGITYYDNDKFIFNSKETVFLYAQWESDTFNISYDLKGGEFDYEAPSSYKSGDSVTIKNPKRIGYSFEGWKLVAGNESHFEESKDSSKIDRRATEDYVLEAKWTPIEYWVKYDDNYKDSGYGLKDHHVYDKEFKLANRKREGYVLLGWNTKSNGKGVFYKAKQSVKNLANEENTEIILYAQWIKLNKTKVVLKPKETSKLAIKGANVNVKWKTKDKGIATVNSQGVVKGKKVGNTAVYAEIDGVTISCKVYITKLTNIRVANNIKLGKKFVLIAAKYFNNMANMLGTGTNQKKLGDFKKFNSIRNNTLKSLKGLKEKVKVAKKNGVSKQEKAYLANLLSNIQEYEKLVRDMDKNTTISQIAGHLKKQEKIVDGSNLNKILAKGELYMMEYYLQIGDTKSAKERKEKYNEYISK